jgi:uncharacterized membrane protein required for colicin V production
LLTLIMHIVDIIFLCAAAVVVLLGVKRGLITEAFRLAAVAAGVFVAALFYDLAAPMLSFVDMPDGVRNSVAFVVVFVAILAVVLAVGWTVRKVVHLTVLGWVDRLCGGVLGFAKVALVAWVLALVAAALPIPAMHKSLKRSVVYSTCGRLPLNLGAPDVSGVRQTIEDIVDDNPVGQVTGKLKELREKVDSAKGALQ